MTKETFVTRYGPHGTLRDAWNACNNPGHLVELAILLAPTPMQWRLMLADMLHEFAPHPVIEGLLRDPATTSGQFLDAYAAAYAASYTSNAAARAAARAAADAAAAASYTAASYTSNADAAAANAANACGIVATVANVSVVCGFIRARAPWVLRPASTERQVTVGQRLVRVATRDMGELRHEVQDVEVTKIGSCYFYVAPPQTPRCQSQHRLDNWEENTDGCRKRTLYVSREAWQDLQDHRKAVSDIRRAFSTFPIDPKIQQIPLEALRDLLNRIQ